MAEAYVIGCPDDVTGEAVHAFVVPATGREPDIARLRERVARSLGEAWVPQSIRTVAEVPLAPSGKPDKRALARCTSTTIRP